MDNSKFYHSEQEFQFFNLIGRVNLKNGRCKYFIPTLSSNYGNYQINTFLVYNSQIDYRFFSSIIGLNQKWKFNFQQFVYPYKSDYNIEGFNVGDYLYIDEEWNLHRFIFYKAENNILYYYDDAGTKFKLLVNNDLIKLEKNDCYLFFNKDAGYIEKICSKFYDITKEFYYNNGLIESIYDTRNRIDRVSLIYNEQKQIKYMVDSNTNLTIEFGYDKNGNFNQISYKDNPFEKTIYKFIYQNKFLTQIIDIFKNHSMELTYNFDKLTMIKSTLLKVNHQKDYKVPELYVNEESASDLIYLSNKKIGIKNTEYSYDEELDVYNLINLNYTSSYCDVTIDNKDTTRYYFDTLGHVISSFKVNNNSFELLNDHHGIPLGYNGKTFNLNNNGNYVSNELVYNSDDIDDLKEDLKDGIVENDYENYRSFTVSFFISTLATIGKNTKIKMIIDDETYYSYVQKCDSNVLQMCQIQILLPDTFWDKSKTHTWRIKLSNDMPFYIYDIRLNKSSISKITFIDDSYNVDELKKMTYFKYCVDNEYTYVSINNEINDNVDNEDFYFSLSDLLETCKSLYISRISNNPTFSLYYCNLTKIKEVEQASFYNGEQWFDLGLFTNRTANVRTHNVTHFNDNYYLTLEKEFSFNFDGGKNQLYLETKTFYNLGVEHSFLYDDICKKSYVWYNEDGTFRASCDEQNIMKEINYDSYGNIIEELVYKHGERNLPVSFVEYYYENEIPSRRLPYAINHNGVIQSYDYDILGKVKRIYNVGVSDNSFKEGVYDDQKITYEYGNDLETLKAIKFERYVDANNENDDNTNNISDYQIVEKNEILINNQGLIKNIKNNYLNYEYDYDELFRLKNIKQNNQLVFANIYYPLYLENKNEIKKIWLDNYITINLDEHGQVDKLYIGKTIDTQYRVKSLELYRDLEEAVSKLNNIEIDSNSLSEVLNLSVYQSLEKDSFLQDSKYVVDKFSNSLHVYFKNNFIDSLNYKLIDDYNNIRQEIKYLQKETIYDIIDGRVKFKVGQTEIEPIDNSSNSFIQTKYYNCVNLGCENEAFVLDDLLSKTNTFDPYGRLISSNSSKFFDCQTYHDYLFTDVTDFTIKYLPNVLVEHNKEIQYKNSSNLNGNYSLNNVKKPSKIIYNYIRNFTESYNDNDQSNFVSSDSTSVINEVEFDDSNRIIQLRTSGNYFLSNVLTEDTNQTASIVDTTFSYLYDEKDQLYKEIVTKTYHTDEESTNSESHSYTYLYENGELVKVQSDLFTKTYSYVDIDDNDKQLVINCSKKLNYTLKSNNVVVESNNIYFDTFGNVVRYNDYNLEYGHNNLLSNYYKENVDNVMGDELLSIFYDYDGYGKRTSKNVDYNNTKYRIQYYYDNEKLICQNWYSLNNANYNYELQYKFIFTYDLDGISGIKVYDYSYNDLDSVSTKYIRNGVNYTFIKDHLNNVTGIVRDTKLICQYEYDAWGNHTINNLVDDSVVLFELDHFVVNNNPFRYRGYYYDVETQLYWVSSRYYSPELCRWISPDSIEYLDPESINGLNLYAYCNNDPVNKYDPTGHIAISLIVGLVVSFAIGTTASAISQYVQYGEVNLLQAGVDGLFAVASTALAYTGIGLIGSIAAGAGMGLAQYTLDSAVFHDDFSWSGALIATGLGALGGLASGRGAQHFKSIGSNLDDTGRTGVKAILTAFDKYGTGAGYQKVMNLWGGRVANSLAKSISQNFTKSALIIWGTTAATYGASYGLGQINWGF